MVEVEVDMILVKRWLKLFIFRVLVLGAHYLAVMDGLASMAKYPALKSKFTGPIKNITGLNITSKAVVKPAKIEVCNMKSRLATKDLDSALLNFNMSLFLLMGFYGVAVVNFIVKTIVHLRLAICPVWGEPDGLGNPQPTTWHKIQNMTFNLATFPCDMANMSCIVGLYAVKRGTKGLGCWECYVEPTCKSKKDFEAILFMSSLALNVNFILVLGIVFYKGFIAYFRSTDPEKCDCHCVVPRCVTGCFVSLVVTSVVMMPPFLVMQDKYFSLKEVTPNFFADIMEKMMLVGIVIWAVAGIFVFIVVPLKMILMRDKDPKKK